MKRIVKIGILAAVHFGLSFWLAGVSIGIALGHDHPGANPYSTAETIIGTTATIINLPIVTGWERMPHSIHLGSWYYSLFVLNSILWGGALYFFGSRLCRWKATTGHKVRSLPSVTACSGPPARKRLK